MYDRIRVIVEELGADDLRVLVGIAERLLAAAKRTDEAERASPPD